MDFVEFRHQVAIVGQVTDARTDRVLARAQVRITSAPPLFVERLVTLAKGVRISDPALVATRALLDNPGASAAQRLAAAQKILDFLQARRFVTSRRPDRTQAAADGIFFFVDLPAGAYTLVASLTGVGTRYGEGQTTATVTHNQGNIALAQADIAIPSTTVRGAITGPSLDGDGSVTPVPLATIQVRGSGERTYSKSDGGYLLAGLEVGQRTILITARGYQPREQRVTFSAAGAEQILNVTLPLLA